MAFSKRKHVVGRGKVANPHIKKGDRAKIQLSCGGIRYLIKGLNEYFGFEVLKYKTEEAVYARCILIAILFIYYKKIKPLDIRIETWLSLYFISYTKQKVLIKYKYNEEFKKEVDLIFYKIVYDRDGIQGWRVSL